MAEHGVLAGVTTMWKILRRLGLTLERIGSGRRAGTRRRRPPCMGRSAGPLGQVRAAGSPLHRIVGARALDLDATTGLVGATRRPVVMRGWAVSRAGGNAGSRRTQPDLPPTGKPKWGAGAKTTAPPLGRGLRCGLAALAVCVVAATAQAIPSGAGLVPIEAGWPAPWPPPGLPLDADGIPTRPLTDDELFRLLVALSARNQPAVELLARCHAAGTPHGHPGWRACILTR